MKKFGLMLTALLGLTAVNSINAQCVATTDGSGIQCKTLIAGQTIDAGTVCAEVVGTDLVVTYTTHDGWELVETHLWIGDDIANMPQTRKGNPKLGNFPYNSGDVTGDTTYSVTIPLNILNFICPGDDNTYFVSAHAALRKDDGAGGYQTETGWLDGARFVEKGSWAMFSSTTLTCNCGGDTPPPPDRQCETAFAFGETCFLDIDEDGDGAGDFNRWGWTIGPLSPGTVTPAEIFAGAGQCDKNKGTFVGMLTISYDGVEATVTFEMLAGFDMDATHLYVGNEILPRSQPGPTQPIGELTVAPGQYGNIHDLTEATTDTFIVEVKGDIYVVAHAAVFCVDVP